MASHDFKEGIMNLSHRIVLMSAALAIALAAFAGTQPASGVRPWGRTG
jgi:hypothetical protein